MESLRNYQTTSITTTQGRQKPPPLYLLWNEETHQGDLLRVIPNGGKIPNQKIPKLPPPQSLMEGEKRKGYQLKKSDQWIFDCGATDTMTHDPHDFDSLSTPVKTHIEIAVEN